MTVFFNSCCVISGCKLIFYLPDQLSASQPAMGTGMGSPKNNIINSISSSSQSDNDEDLKHFYGSSTTPADQNNLFLPKPKLKKGGSVNGKAQKANQHSTSNKVIRDYSILETDQRTYYCFKFLICIYTHTYTHTPSIYFHTYKDRKLTRNLYIYTFSRAVARPVTATNTLLVIVRMETHRRYVGKVLVLLGTLKSGLGI